MTTLTLSDRAMSGFPVSIGTGLALETIFTPTQPVIDDSRIPPPKIVRDEYNHYLINASTLVRNLISSLPYKDFVSIPFQAVLDTLLEELDYLTGLFESQSLHLSIYHHTYLAPLGKYMEKIRAASTDQQRHVQDVTHKCLKHLRTQDDVHVFSDKITYDRQSRALVLTHIPYDLLSHANFSKFDLLESHTGVVKSRRHWYSKYMKVPDTDMSFLPFTESLLTTLGDNVMFKPDKLSDRVALIQLLQSRNVHPLMSEQTLTYALSGT